MVKSQKNQIKMTTLRNKSINELNDINKKLLNVSDKIETKMKFLQDKYGFEIDYAFKPITQEEIDNS